MDPCACFPRMRIFIHKRFFSAISIVSPFESPPSGMMMRSCLRNSLCFFKRYCMPYTEPTSSSAANKSFTVYSGTMPFFTYASAANTPLHKPCWSSSTPRPKSFPSFSYTFHGSADHSEISPTGTTSKWAITHMLRLSLLPCIVATRFGRMPDFTRLSGASKRAKSVIPSFLSHCSRAIHFSSSPSPPLSGARAGCEVKSVSKSTIAFFWESIQSVSCFKLIFHLCFYRRPRLSRSVYRHPNVRPSSPVFRGHKPRLHTNRRDLRLCVRQILRE